MPAVEILDRHLPIVAIIGRPNVGKSTLFNRLIGRRKAVVLDTPGVTRDRNFEPMEWQGRRVMLIDTGGYETTPRDKVFDQMREQSLMAVEEADLVLLMVDITEPDNPVDEDVAGILRRAGKPVVIAVNKCDNARRHQESYSFYHLGFDDLFAISAQSGGGVGDLLDRIVEMLPGEPDINVGEEDKGIKIAVIGRQNTGKSTLVNSILQSERVIASDLPGTTRDTIDTAFRFNEKIYTLIDTAGIRRRGKIERGTEQLSVFSAQASLNRCDVALILVDASQGLTDQDMHIAGYAFEAFRPCVLVLNKWDLVEKETETADQFAKLLHKEMGFLNHAPVVTLSAKTKQRVHRILPMVDEVYGASMKEIETVELNRWLQNILKQQSPPVHKGRTLRIKYAVQTGVHPPTFAFFVNDPEIMHFSYQRFLINQLRESYGFKGVPIRIRLKRKSKKDGEE